MKNTIRRVLVSKRFYIPVAVLLFYTITGFLIAPMVVRWYVPKFTQDQLKCETTVGKVRINPWLLRFEVNDFSMRDPDGSPLLQFTRFFFDFELSSLWSWAGVFRELRLEKPMLNLVINADGTLNYSRLVPKPAEQKPESKDLSNSKPVRLIFRKLELTGGDVTITDRRQATPAVLDFQDLNLDLKSLSTHLDQNGTCSLVAKTQNGESISWQGDIYLAPFRSRGKVLFSGFQAATLLRFQQNNLNLDSPSGILTISTDYSIDARETPLQVALENFKIDISKLALKLSGTDELFFELGKFEFDSALVDLAAKAIRTNKLRVDGGKLDLRIDEAGQSNLEKIVRRAPAGKREETISVSQEGTAEKETPTEKPTPAPGDIKSSASEAPWKVNIDAVEVKDMALGIEDLSRVSPLSAAAAGISFSTRASIEAGPKLMVSAKEIVTELKGVHLGVKGAPKPLFEAQELSLEGGEFDLGAHSLSIARIALSNGHLDVGISEDGKSNIEKLLSKRAKLFAAQVKHKTSSSSDDSKPSASETPWKVSIDAIEVKDMALGFDDLSRVSPLSAAVSNISFSTKASVEAGPKPVVSVKEIATELKGVHLGVKGAPKPLFDAQTLSLEGGEVDLGARSLSIARIALKDGHLDVGVSEDGKSNLEKLLSSKAGSPAGLENKSSASQDRPWAFLLKTFELSNFNSALSDHKVLPGKDLYVLHNIGARVTDINGRSPMNFEMGFTVEQGGKVALGGKVDPASQSVEARVNVAGLVLSPLQPYIEPYITLTLQSAAVSTQGVFRYGLPKATPKLTYEGSFGLDKLSLNQPKSKETYLGWESMQIQQLKFAMEPNSLQIPEIRLSKPTGELIIAEDHSVNLASIVKDQQPKSVQQPVSPSRVSSKGAAKKSDKVPASPQKQDSGPFNINIGKVRVNDGNVLFADFSLKPKFMARIQQLKGTVSKLSLENRL